MSKDTLIKLANMFGRGKGKNIIGTSDSICTLTRKVPPNPSNVLRLLLGRWIRTKGL